MRKGLLSEVVAGNTPEARGAVVDALLCTAPRGGSGRLHPGAGGLMALRGAPRGAYAWSSRCPRVSRCPYAAGRVAAGADRQRLSGGPMIQGPSW